MSRAPFLMNEGGGTEEEHGYTNPINESSGRQRFPVAPSGAKDRAWGIAFKISVAITLISALFFGGTGTKALSHPEILFGWSPSFNGGDGGWLLTFFLGIPILALAWAFSWGLLVMLINCSKQILKVAFLGGCAMWAVAMVTALGKGQILIGLVSCVISGFYVRFYWLSQGRIEFGGENLKVAALAIKSMPWTIRSALLMGAFQLFWAAIVSLAASGTVAALTTVRVPDGSDVYRAVECHNAKNPETMSLSCKCNGEFIDDTVCSYGGGGGALTLFWFAILIWSGEVIRNVLAATVTGSVASWWYTPHITNPVLGAFYRATGSSFGSLCKASAITGAVRLLRMIVQRSPRLRRLMRFMLACVQAAVDYAVAYTICFIGIYGLSFSEAGSRVGELFLSRGVTTIANDAVVDIGLSLFAVAATAFYLMAAIALVLAFLAMGGGIIMIIFAFVGFIVCLIAISTTLEVVRSGFKAVFVCFVQDPDVLAANHGRQLHADLSRAWEKIQQKGPGKSVGHLREVEQV